MIKNFLHEFKQFAIKGSVVDLAVGVIIGTTFGKIVASLVEDVIMPLIGLVVSNVPVSDLHVGPVAIGNFMQSVIDFAIVALVIFSMMKLINVVRHKERQLKPREISKEEELLTEIRDLLKK